MQARCRMHMLDIRELTTEAFAPCGQVIAQLRTGSQGAEISYDRSNASRGCAKPWRSV